MKKVHIVSTGDYPDEYEIDTVFTNLKKAEKYAKIVPDGSVETFVLNKPKIEKGKWSEEITQAIQKFIRENKKDKK